VVAFVCLRLRLLSLAFAVTCFSLHPEHFLVDARDHSYRSSSQIPHLTIPQTPATMPRAQRAASLSDSQPADAIEVIPTPSRRRRVSAPTELLYHVPTITPFAGEPPRVRVPTTNTEQQVDTPFDYGECEIWLLRTDDWWETTMHIARTRELLELAWWIETDQFPLRTRLIEDGESFSFLPFCSCSSFCSSPFWLLSSFRLPSTFYLLFASLSPVSILPPFFFSLPSPFCLHHFFPRSAFCLHSTFCLLSGVARTRLKGKMWLGLERAWSDVYRN
jgi:hypothetical protein